MNATSSMLPENIVAFSRMEPVSALSTGALARLSQMAAVHEIKRGTDLIGAGDWSGRLVYLLRGEMKLEYPNQSGHHMVVVVVGGSGMGRLPIWSAHAPAKVAHRRTVSAGVATPVTITAINDCVALSLDEESMDLVVTWDQLAENRPPPASPDAIAHEAANDARPEWQNLTNLCADQSLVASAFANVPAANIERLLASFQRMDCVRGDDVVRQGDEGDYYYLIERGRCRVTRSIGGVETELAELCDGEGFGEEALVASARRNATVSMKTDGVLWRLAKADFLALLQEPLLHRISCADALAGAMKNAVWLDTRFPVEFRQNGIKGAINVPLNEIRDASSVLDKSRDYIVYCQTGRRSSAAAFLLSQRGIRAFLLEGGLNAMVELTESAA